MEKDIAAHEAYLVKRITALRLKKQVSEHKMSLELGQSGGYIHQITSGRSQPSMHMFLQICEYFSVTPFEFWDRENENPELLQELLAHAKHVPPDALRAIIELVKQLPAAAD